MTAVGVEAAVGPMLTGGPFQFVEVQGVAFGAAQGCQRHANAKGVHCDDRAAGEKVGTSEVTQQLGAEFLDAGREEILPVG